MRRAAKVDTTQQAIVDRLRACSVTVEIIGKPLDLLICHRGETSLMEVKTPNNGHAGEGLTKAQVEFIARWPGKIHVVKTPDEAVRSVLGPEHCDPPFTSNNPIAEPVMLGDIDARLVPF